MGLFVTKKTGNGWKLLLTVATWIMLLTWQLDLKYIDQFRLRQLSIPSTIYMFKVSKITQKSKNKTLEQCQYIFKVNNKEPEQRLVPLLLTLNIFLTLFYCYYC